MADNIGAGNHREKAPGVDVGGLAPRQFQGAMKARSFPVISVDSDFINYTLLETPPSSIGPGLNERRELHVGTFCAGLEETCDDHSARQSA